MWIFIRYSISTKVYDQKKTSSSDATSALLLSVLSVTAESKCHPAQLRGLVSSGTETLGHLVSLCLQDLKQKWWSSQPQNKPLMISLYNYKLTFSLSHQLFWWSALVCCPLGKKKSPTKLPLETNMWGKIKPYFGLTSTFLTLLTQLQERGFFQFTHQ